MTKNLRTVKTTIITGILLISIIAAMAPAISAQDQVVGLQSLVNIDPQSIGQIKPRSGLQQANLNISYQVTTGGILARAILPWLEGRQVTINLAIISTPSWCHAQLIDSTKTTTVPTDGRAISLSAAISISLDADAPAFGGGYVNVRATVPKISFIQGFDKEISVPFTPLYLGLLKTETMGTNTKTIGPMDTAVFPIKIENLGNARTKVYLAVDNVPDGWVAIVDDSIVVDEAAGSTATAYLTVRPPKDFGYHDDISTITVSLEPARAEDTTDRGSVETVTVSVESRGFSFVGGEIVLPIIIIIVALLFVVYWFIKRMRK